MQDDHGQQQDGGTADDELDEDDLATPTGSGRPVHVERGEPADVEGRMHEFTVAQTIVNG